VIALIIEGKEYIFEGIVEGRIISGRRGQTDSDMIRYLSRRGITDFRGDDP
jgi:hypothetical protein